MKSKVEHMVDRVVVVYDNYGTVSKNIKASDLVVFNSEETGQISLGELVELYLQVKEDYTAIKDNYKKLTEAFKNLARAFDSMNQNVEIIKLEVFK